MLKLVRDKGALERAAHFLADKIALGEIATSQQLESEKIKAAKVFGFEKIPKNAELLPLLHERGDFEEIKKLLSMKPVRTASGVANIAVMWSSGIDIGDGKFFSCPADCIYCPQGRNAPKSYTGVEPTTLRAIRNNYDPYMQVANRLYHFRITGHPTDKCELIIMGGTFTAMNNAFRQNFIRRCLDAMNGCDSRSVEEAIKINETAANRCVGMTVETRADFCDSRAIDEMLECGITRVEIGVQSTSDRLLDAINRGHDAQCNKDAFGRLRSAGLKITAHWMPGLTGLFGINMDEEVSLFRQLFADPAYRPDELKIYPTLVMPGTKLHELWKAGEYEALSKEDALRLLLALKKHVPRYVRIKRIMRDISEHEVAGGPGKTNLRQLANEVGAVCKCIRCREVGLTKKRAAKGEIKLLVDQYEASNGVEFFLSFEDDNDILFGFLRLRLDSNARVRELHVYGDMAPIGAHDAHRHTHIQHRGLGKKLLAEAEEIARSFGFDKISVTSGVGVRAYYKKLGYFPNGPYMVKAL